jgi:hypothetical protein
MCLLCEELWMPFEPPEAKGRTFMADSPQADGARNAPEQAPASGFPSPHSRSEWRGGVRGGGPLPSANPADGINKDPPPGSLRSPPSPPLASLAGGGKEQD